MSFTVKISGFDETVIMFELRWIRNLGNVVHFDIILNLHEDQRDYWSIVDKLANSALNKDFIAQVFLNETNITPELSISAITNIEKENNHYFKLSGRFTNVSKDFFTPRKRVLKAKNLKTLLLDPFSEYLFAAGDIIDELYGFDISFDNKPCYVFQDLLSDWDIINRIVNYYNLNVAAAKRILITGYEKENKFRISWADKDQIFNARTRPREIDNIDEDHILPKFKKDNNFEVGVNHQPLSVFYSFKRTNTSSKAWIDWTQSLLPIKYKERFAAEVIDRLVLTKQEGVKWTTDLLFYQDNSIGNVELDLKNEVGWLGKAVVAERSDKATWITAKLDAFEDGFNTVEARLTSLYSGEHGKAGLHLVPEKDSEVFLVKPNDWLSPVFFAGNIRATDANQQSPSWFMGSSSLKWNFDELDIKMKKLMANSENHISISAKEEVTIKGSQSVNLSTEGVKIAIDNVEMKIN